MNLPCTVRKQKDPLPVGPHFRARQLNSNIPSWVLIELDGKCSSDLHGSAWVTSTSMNPTTSLCHPLNLFVAFIILLLSICVTSSNLAPTPQDISCANNIFDESNFTSRISELVAEHRDHLEVETSTRTCFVIGSGPVGLTSALAAFRSGYKITIVDPRPRNSPLTTGRDIYFDIASSGINLNAKNYPSLEFLESLGIVQFLNSDTSSYYTASDGSRVLQISCGELEQFLVTVLVAAGKVVGEDIIVFVADSFTTKTSDSYLMSGDLYIVAEGANSRFKKEVSERARLQTHHCSPQKLLVTDQIVPRALRRSPFIMKRSPSFTCLQMGNHIHMMARLFTSRLS